MTSRPFSARARGLDRRASRHRAARASAAARRGWPAPSRSTAHARPRAGRRPRSSASSISAGRRSQVLPVHHGVQRQRQPGLRAPAARPPACAACAPAMPPMRSAPAASASCTESCTWSSPASASARHQRRVQQHAGGDQVGVEPGRARRRDEVHDVAPRRRLAAREMHLQARPAPRPPGTRAPRSAVSSSAAARVSSSGFEQ